MCPLCMTTIFAIVGGPAAAGSIGAFVATKLRLSIRNENPSKTERSSISVEMYPNQPSHDIRRPAGRTRGINEYEARRMNL
jgi:hypothetical protein